MEVKRILLTGDDGYKAIGMRLLVHFLKDSFDLQIAATLKQMSGVGGHLSLKNGCIWGTDTLDGVPVMWVDGYPCDAIEATAGKTDYPYDLIISGINKGMNIGGALISSGTYSAANRAIHLRLAPKALVLSWWCPKDFWLTQHDDDEPIGPYLDYPGRIADRTVRKAIEADLWGADMLNINFPSRPSNVARFTKGLPDNRLFFNYPMQRDKKTKLVSYPAKPEMTVTRDHPEWDTGAMLSGYISITPEKPDFLNEEVYEKMKGRTVKV
jgi:5'/3'-nucleotidase SurE